MSEFSEEVETLRKQLLEKELELKEKDELLKRWEGAVTKPDGSSYGLHEHHTPLCHGMKATVCYSADKLDEK